MIRTFEKVAIECVLSIIRAKKNEEKFLI